MTWDNAVAALSPDDVWTAGYQQTSTPDLPGLRTADLGLLQHWNGKRWTQYPSPDFTDGSGSGTAQFNGLSFDRPDDGWAVGLESATSETDVGTPLVAHWNGTSWTPSPVLEPFKTETVNGQTTVDYTALNVVKAISPDDVWAGGWLVTLSRVNGFDGSFLEHWNGSSWKFVEFPGQASDELQSITAFGQRDLWATEDSPDGPIPLHWNGRTWTESRYAAHGNDAISIRSLSGTSADSMWATGQDVLGASAAGVPMAIPYIEHWNGKTWSKSPITDVDSVEGLESVLESVSAISASDAWASGTWDGRPGGIEESNGYLLTHWNGRQWTVSKVSQSPLQYGLQAVSASSARNVWISGEQMEYEPTGVDAFAPYLLRYGCGQE
jgi:hypothetical protein